MNFTNTKVEGSGMVRLNKGRILCYGTVGGDIWSLEIGDGSKLLLFNGFGNIRSNLTVSNFVNKGSIETSNTIGTLIVKGVLTQGNSIRDLKLDGATIKVTGTTPQEVSYAFSASGTIKVDTSEITADKFASAENGEIGLIPVLTIPKGLYSEAFKSWQISGIDASMRSLRWRQNGNNMTLYVARPGGTKIIIR